MTKLNLRGQTFQPQAKLSYYSYYSCNDWISPAKFGWAIVNVTAPSMVTDLSSVSLAMELFPSSFMTLREPQAWGLGECNWVGLGKYVWAKICWTGNMCNMLHLHSYIQSSLQSTYELYNRQEVTWSQKVQSFVFLTPALCSVSSILEVVQTTSHPSKNTAPILCFSADSWININVRRITVNILFEICPNIQNPDL